MMATLAGDIRYALRGMMTKRAFSAVVLASLVIEIGGGPSRGLGEELVGEQTADASVQPAGLEPHGSTRAFGNVEHYPVPVPLSGGDGHEDQELDGLERKEVFRRRGLGCLGHIGVSTICKLTLVPRKWFDGT